MDTVAKALAKAMVEDKAANPSNPVTHAGRVWRVYSGSADHRASHSCCPTPAACESTAQAQNATINLRLCT